MPFKMTNFVQNSILMAKFALKCNPRIISSPLNIFKLNQFSVSDCRFYAKKTIAEELNLPNPPKRPINGVLKYALGLKVKHPDKPLEDLMRLYKDLPDEEKLSYKESYTKDMLEYRENLKAYQANLTNDEKLKIEELALKRKVESLKKISAKQALMDKMLMKKEAENLGKPKHPGNSFSVYVKEIRSSTDPTISVVKCTHKWHALTPTEKEKYKDIFKQKVSIFREELEDWEKRMAAEGRLELLRKNSPFLKVEDIPKP